MTTKRLQNEPEKHYELFNTYRLMGFGRSITELAKIHKVSRQHIYDLAKKYNWKERIAKNDKEILNDIREEHNKTFQSEALLRRENIVNAYSLLQNTFSKMLSYSSKYTSNTMEPEEFLNKTDKLFTSMQRYERISQSCEKYLEKFGIETVGQTNEVYSELDNINLDLADFNEENSNLCDQEIQPSNESKSSVDNDLLDLSHFLPKQNLDFDLTEEELQKIDKEVKFGFPKEASEKERQNY
jgi:hypothetical protein